MGLHYLCTQNYITMKEINANNKKYIIVAVVCSLTIMGFFYYYFFYTFSKLSKVEFLYIDQDDNIDSVFSKLSPIASNHGLQGLKTLIRHSTYLDNIKTGRYEISTSIGALQLFHHLKSGMQTPISLTIPSVRTVEDLSIALSSKLMLNEVAINSALTNQDTCKSYGYTPETIICMFIPNTYNLYWNISLSKLLNRMKKESDAFWTTTRMAKAKQLGLSPIEVITLASIVDEETTNNAEKPIVAGMYYNRLKIRNTEYPHGMPLQADPTVKFALKQFAIKRIYHNMLKTKSPYNTYFNIGLPPGPIRIPTTAGIDAVLNMVHHNYIYMCAKEDFSGAHNFASNYREHQANATKYSKALNSRGIK